MSLNGLAKKIRSNLFFVLGFDGHLRNETVKTHLGRKSQRMKWIVKNPFRINYWRKLLVYISVFSG